jgi:hypothetical protein
MLACVSNLPPHSLSRRITPVTQYAKSPKLRTGAKPHVPLIHLDQRSPVSTKSLLHRQLDDPHTVGMHLIVSKNDLHHNLALGTDLLWEHHKKNGAPKPPNPAALAQSRKHAATSQAESHRVDDEEEMDVDDGDGEGETELHAVYKPATQMKFYSTSAWHYILDRARHHSRLAATVDGFPDRLSMLSTYADEYLTQAMSEYEERGVKFDKGLFAKYGYEMGILVCT